MKLAVATEHAGVSVNDLTDDQMLDTLSGNAAFSGVPVDVRAAPHEEKGDGPSVSRSPQ